MTQLSSDSTAVADGLAVTEGVAVGVAVGEGITVGVLVGVSVGIADDSIVKLHRALRWLICSVALIVCCPPSQLGLTVKVTSRVPSSLVMMVLFDVVTWVFGCVFVATPTDVEA